jgi:thiamine-phosphate pyrophosphorylase
MPVDVRLNAIVDPERAGGRNLAELARLCAEGGATLIQLRDKKSDACDMIASARAIKQALKPFGVPFVVNDRVDVALAAEADGVHLGPEDMTAEDARRLLGPKALIGISVKSTDAAEAAPIELIDYVGSGGVYGTLSKQQKNAPIGPEGLGRIAAVLHRRAPQLPVAGIAGIDADNAAAVIAAGANGVAVISAISLAPDPAAAARTLRTIVDAALAERGV